MTRNWSSVDSPHKNASNSWFWFFWWCWQLIRQPACITYRWFMVLKYHLFTYNGITLIWLPQMWKTFVWMRLNAGHYDDAIIAAMASQITSLTIVYSTVYSGAYQSKHQSSASLAFVWGIHRGPVNSTHKWPVTRKMFPFDDVIMHRHSISLVVWLLTSLSPVERVQTLLY